MAIVEDVNKIAVAMKLNNGQTSTGAIKTVNVSLGTIAYQTYEAQKALNIAEALAPCLDRTLYAVQKTTTANLSED